MTPTPKTVLEMIYEWSLTRPLWQRDALRRIVARGALGDADIDELVLLCKKESGDDAVTISSVPLEKKDLPSNPGAAASLSLTSVSDVLGVNQLAASQTLEFEPTGLTIIYGDNGAGKSGYARLLKRACRARYPGEIMPDAYDPAAPKQASASIVYEAAGAQKTVAWADDEKPHGILSAVSVFDRESGAVHVKNKNEVAFRPFGLDIPDELASACQAVKAVLQKEQTALEKSRDVAFEKPDWKSTTAAGKALNILTGKTKIADLQKLAKTSEEEKARHRTLNEDLARDPLKAAREQSLYADEMRKLAAALQGVGREFSDAALQVLHSLSVDARGKRGAATHAAQSAFGNPVLPEIGGTAWRAMWQAAQHYAQHIGQVVPPTDEKAVCLYCHQPLTKDARERISGFDAFVKNDVERQAAEAELKFDEARKRFDKLRIATTGYAAARRKLALAEPTLAREVLRCLASARLRFIKCTAQLDEKSGTLTLAPLEADVSAKVTGVEERARKYADELKQAARIEGRRALEAERDELGDRILLEKLMPKAEAEVARIRSLRLIEKALGETTTTTITKLGNEIADSVITPKIRDEFQREIIKLAADRVRVEIVRAGGKFGSPQYQVRLFANPHAPVHDVLSEGEQTCVALAAFLTELATASHKSALVFDDPVSSLDHWWREQVAKRLAEEAKVRQVIIFTHDAVFLQDVKYAAEQLGLPMKLTTVSRTSVGAGTVTDGLPWLSASIGDRVDKLEKEAREAKKLYDAGDFDNYRHAVHRIYSRLRSTWERAIEDVAVHGVIQRHRDYINTKNFRKMTALAESDVNVFDVGYKRCCDQIDAHDGARARNPAPSPPNEVLADIQAVADWAKALRDKQRAIE